MLRVIYKIKNEEFGKSITWGDEFMRLKIGQKMVLGLIILITLPPLIVGYRTASTTEKVMTEQYVNAILLC